jgi:type III pantothenate kinase
MEIVIDAGNTRVKVYFFLEKKIVRTSVFNYSEMDFLLQAIAEFPDAPIILSDVSGAIPSNSLYKEHSRIFMCTISLDLPIQIEYQSKNTLGFDRVAAAVGAVSIRPDSHKIIIDAGTALTIDYVDNTNTFKGGVISPGMALRFSSLHEKTGKLPLFSPPNQINLFGTSTQEAIQYGVVQGMVFEISQYIASYNTIFPDIDVFLCGGDCFFFEKMLKKPIFAEPNLNALGLHSIYNYNVTT